MKLGCPTQSKGCEEPPRHNSGIKPQATCVIGAAEDREVLAYPMSGSNVYSKHTASRGNGLFASRPVLPGELIFGIDQPAVAVPDTARLGDTCSNCFAGASRGDAADHVVLSTCTGCHTVRYCTKVGFRSYE